MNTIKFNNKDSFRDYGLILKPYTLPLPKAKTNYVSVPGRDGSLDLTNALTEDVKYEDVEISLEFYIKGDRKNYREKLKNITAELHGQKIKVVFSEDPTYYYNARVELDEFSTDQNIGTIGLKLLCEPYKLKVTETVITEAVVAGKVVTLNNSRKWVTPTVTTTAEVKFTHAGKQITVNGTFKSPDFILKSGATSITLNSGTGNIVIKYREGALI